MAKKISVFERRKLLEERDRGASIAELKERFGIKDERTVMRNLKLAEDEQEAKLIMREIRREAQASHLGEIEELIKRWKDGIKLSPYDIGVDTMAASRNIETELLFEGVREHLRSSEFRAVWDNYKSWKAKHREYVGKGKELPGEIRRKGKEIMERKVEDYPDAEPRLTPKFEKPMIRALTPVILGGKPEPFSFEWQVATTELKLLIVNGENVLETTTDANEKVYQDRYQKLFDDCLKDMEPIKGLFSDLGDCQAKIGRLLDKILWRRDYIRYSCGLCPVKARQPR